MLITVLIMSRVGFQRHMLTDVYSSVEYGTSSALTVEDFAFGFGIPGMVRSI